MTDHGDAAGRDDEADGHGGDGVADEHGGDGTAASGDTFGVGIQVAAEEFRFVVHVPSEIDSGWSDPDEFQRLIERETWEVLDRRETLRAVDDAAGEGETVTLGTVTMRPDGSVVGHTLSPPGE